MPEGDTVWRAARSLDRALAGQLLTDTDFRVPRLATADLAGGRVRQTVSRGKHLLTHIDHEHHAWTLHTHLKMEGSWHTYQPHQRWRRPEHEARLVLSTADKVVVGFALGIVELLPRGEEHRVVGHLDRLSLAHTAAVPARLTGRSPPGMSTRVRLHRRQKFTDRPNPVTGRLRIRDVRRIRWEHPFSAFRAGLPDSTSLEGNVMSFTRSMPMCGRDKRHERHEERRDWHHEQREDCGGKQWRDSGCHDWERPTSERRW